MTKRYFAFISYSSKDKKEAVRLQRKLQNYRIPTAIIKKHDGIPERVSPVFRDDSDLVGHTVLKALDTYLDDSRFLIVLCSPSSAQSFYVNYEVQHFIDSGRKNAIIPYIIEGRADTSYPPALRGDGTCDPILGYNKETGVDLCLLKIVATMFNLRLDELHSLEKERLKKKRRSMSILVSAAALLLSVIVIGFILSRKTIENTRIQTILSNVRNSLYDGEIAKPLLVLDSIAQIKNGYYIGTPQFISLSTAALSSYGQNGVNISLLDDSEGLDVEPCGIGFSNDGSRYVTIHLLKTIRITLRDRMGNIISLYNINNEEEYYQEDINSVRIVFSRDNLLFAFILSETLYVFEIQENENALLLKQPITYTERHLQQVLRFSDDRSYIYARAFNEKQSGVLFNHEKMNGFTTDNMSQCIMCISIDTPTDYSITDSVSDRLFSSADAIYLDTIVLPEKQELAIYHDNKRMVKDTLANYHPIGFTYDNNVCVVDDEKHVFLWIPSLNIVANTSITYDNQPFILDKSSNAYYGFVKKSLLCGTIGYGIPPHMTFSTLNPEPHKGRLTLSPNGRWLFVWNEYDCVIHLYDAPTLSFINDIPIKGELNSLIVSGRTMAAVCNNGKSLQLFDINLTTEYYLSLGHFMDHYLDSRVMSFHYPISISSNFRISKSIINHPCNIDFQSSSLGFLYDYSMPLPKYYDYCSINGKWLVLYSDFGVSLVNLDLRQIVSEIEIDFEDEPLCVFCSEDGSVLMVLSDDNSCSYYDAMTGNIQDLPSNKSFVAGLYRDRFVINNQSLIVLEDERLIRISLTDNTSTSFELSLGSTMELNHIKGDKYMVYGTEGTELWDFSKMKRIKAFYHPILDYLEEDMPFISRQGDWLVTIHEDETHQDENEDGWSLSFIYKNRNKPYNVFPKNDDIVFNASEDLLAHTERDGTLILYDAHANRRTPLPFLHGRGQYRPLAFSPDSKLLALSFVDPKLSEAKILFYDIKANTVISEVNILRKMIDSITIPVTHFSDDGNFFLYYEKESLQGIIVPCLSGEVTADIINYVLK